MVDELAMRCPRCNSTEIDALPPNIHSLRPGYVCRDCKTLMRPAGSTDFYVFAIFVGLGLMLVGSLVLMLVGLGFAALKIGRDPHNIQSLSLGVMFFVVGASAGLWAFVRFLMPIPINASPQSSDGLWIGLLIFLLLVLPILVGCLIFGLVYYMQEMM